MFHKGIEHSAQQKTQQLQHHYSCLLDTPSLKTFLYEISSVHDFKIYNSCIENAGFS